MAKKDSDVFICKPEGGDYWAYPSPFVAHRRGTQIQFRNLTGDTIEIDFGTAPVHEKSLTLAPNKKGVVILDGDALPGLHEYVATVVGKYRTAPNSRRRTPVLVKGGSPPQIIVDT
jgi:hypothetical protein